MSVARIPCATYRLQFNRNFRFDDAAALVGYLRDLGVTDVYASPVLAARAGTAHGYDVVDHERVNPELGGEPGLDRFASSLREAGMGLLLDIVPNHMAIGAPWNRWWADVLENGPASAYAAHFDIEWRPPKAELADKLLLPVLGDQYGRVLNRKEIQVSYDGGGFLATYGEQVFPLAPRSWRRILGPCLEAMRARRGLSHDDVLELESILNALDQLPPSTETAPEQTRIRNREREIAKRRLAALVSSCAPMREAMEAVLADLNGRRDDPSSFDRLDALLADQPYRLSYWRVASDEINYRRFFDVDHLAAICVENPAVFQAVHARVIEMVRKGQVTGLRVDHVDGLYDPLQYLLDLQAACRSAAGASSDGDRAFHVVVEKIIGSDETLHADWPVHGATGYGFLNYVNGLFVDPRNAEAVRKAYEEFAGPLQDFDELVCACKKLIMLVSMAGELHTLAWRLDRVSEQHRVSRDFTVESIRFALREVIATFPVYRTYIRPHDGTVREEDRRLIEGAVRAAKGRNPSTEPSVFDFIGSVLLLEDPPGLTEEQRTARHNFVMRFQQFTGPVMAKALEDTVFYRQFPLASLNEVGGDPRRFGVSRDRFHEQNAQRLRHWPHALIATMTHDAKRGEDVRARISVLSEIPSAWDWAIRRWARLNEGHKTSIRGIRAPDRNEEYLLYQTLVGAWPDGISPAVEWGDFVRRIQEYMIKALREAKVHTSWISPHEPYESAVSAFVAAILRPAQDNEFLSAFREFHPPVARAGLYNSLSQTLLKIASPGVPDFYQGSELWDLRLVDPDNRRPVDFETRRALLDSLRASADPVALLEEMARAPGDGRLKMYVTHRALSFRRGCPDLFARGDYVALAAEGTREENVCAFARVLGARAAIAVAGRFFTGLGDEPGSAPAGPAWGDTALVIPPELRGAAFRDVLTDRPFGPSLALREVFASLPVALLERVA